MLYKFTSRYPSMDWENLPGVQFKNGYFQTEDASIAQALRKKEGVYEITEREAGEEGKKAGRPKKAQTTKATKEAKKERSRTTLATKGALGKLDKEAQEEIAPKPQTVRGARTSELSEGK